MLIDILKNTLELTELEVDVMNGKEEWISFDGVAKSIRAKLATIGCSVIVEERGKGKNKKPYVFGVQWTRGDDE
jgi:hypothetical protein